MTSWCRELRSNVAGDGYVGGVLLAIRNIGVGADFQAAFNRGVLVELENHGLGASRVLSYVPARSRGLRLSHGESEGILLHRSNLSRYGLLWCSGLIVLQTHKRSVVARG